MITLIISEIITMSFKKIDSPIYFGSISRADSWNSDKIAAHEWVLGSPANFSLQRSWLTLLNRFVFFQAFAYGVKPVVQRVIMASQPRDRNISLFTNKTFE